MELGSSYIQHIDDLNLLQEHSKVENAERSNVQDCFKCFLNIYFSNNYFGICFKGVLSCHIEWSRFKICEVLKILKFCIPQVIRGL